MTTPSKQKFLKNRYTETPVNSFSFLEKKNNPQDTYFLSGKNIKNYYIARVDTEKHYYQSTMLSASVVAPSISEEQPPASFPLWATEPENVVTREIPSWQRKLIAFLRAAVLIHLHYSWIKFWLSVLVQDKKYSLSYKLSRFLFCYKTKKWSLSLLLC